MTHGQNTLQEPSPAAVRPGRWPWKQLFLAAAAGLALRLLFVLAFPAPAGDSAIYLELARNWADHSVYALPVNGQLVPADLRVPGYPAFLVLVATLFGRSTRAILLSQAAVDLGTCFLTAALAVALIPAGFSEAVRRRVGIAAMWFAATCPFVANYSAVVLTETLVAFLGTAALICFVISMMDEGKGLIRAPVAGLSHTGFACLGALLTGLASLVRPEMPLLMAIAGALFALRWWKQGGGKVVLMGCAVAAAFLAPLAPWAARNFFTLHEVQVSAPRYATMPGEYAPVGYFSWTKTWLTRYRDVYTALWPLGDDPIQIGDIPPSAFDSPQEKQRVAALLEQYDNSPDLDLTPALDQQFAEIARERTARHPLRTYLWVPASRALTMWFTPRTELLPISAKLLPAAVNWDESHGEYLITALLFALGLGYVALAVGGVFRAHRAEGSRVLQTNYWGIALVMAYLAIRTGFLTTVEAPEPRYIIPCYPAVLALAALVWLPRQE